MRRGHRPELLWGLGLTDTEKTQIESAVGPKFHLRNFPTSRLPWKKELSARETPSVAWIPKRVWDHIPSTKRDAYQELENTQRILINDNEDSLDLEDVLEQGFLTVVRSPLTRDKVRDALFRAKEVTSLYSDIYRMTEEIFLERELLTRKTDQLMFLNKMLTRATQSLDAADILSKAREDLNMLLPVKALHAALWHDSDCATCLDAELYIHGKMTKNVQDAWIEQMLESACKLSEHQVKDFQVHHVNALKRPAGETFLPTAGRVIVQPLKSGKETFGALTMLCDKNTRLAKDEVMVLQSAISHLALALKNSLTHHKVKARAYRDGLTKVYNRQTFDERFLEEMKRHQRYHHDLSLLMVDLDHFKSVNDTYGHQAGDEVLASTAQVLQKSVRTTDMAARYGGEEFVIILPHTPEEQAWNLADRIRKRIAKQNYEFDGKKLRVTASIGVASLEPGALAKDSELLKNADKALYLAKANGRNMVVGASQARQMEG